MFRTLAGVFAQEGKVEDAQIQAERSRSYAVGNTYLFTRTSLLQAQLWYAQSTSGEAKSDELRTLDVLEKLGATDETIY